MNELNQGLLILHLLGLTMGFAVSFANMVLHGVVVKAAPQERDVLSRFSTAMSRVGDVGLALLWVTGLLLVYTKWGGFDVLPWQFQVKMAAVVILTGLVGYIHTLMRKARTGNPAAAARIPVVGRLAFVAGLTFDRRCNVRVRPCKKTGSDSWTVLVTTHARIRYGSCLQRSRLDGLLSIVHGIWTINR
jgi:uncharacterized membrane protein